uniref:Membrane integral NOTCH2 associated receptor 2 n=1 Tax=Labrus bergylta TaxID=56723 RepID=A0A3Q3GLP0_9LABR
MDRMDRRDVSVLPNNNHPDKFLQLDARTLERSRLKPDNRPPPLSPEDTRVVFVDRYLEKHITPFTLKSNIKRNPLYTDIRATDTGGDGKKTKPSWTVREFDTQTMHGNLGDYLKKTAKDLDFWLEDLYTPGFDSLLKKTEAEHKRRKLCKILSAVFLSVCAILVVIIVPVLVLQKKN